MTGAISQLICFPNMSLDNSQKIALFPSENIPIARSRTLSRELGGLPMFSETPARRGWLLLAVLTIAAILLNTVPGRTETSAHRLERKTAKLTKESAIVALKAGAFVGAAAFTIVVNSLCQDDDQPSLFAIGGDFRTHSVGRPGNSPPPATQSTKVEKRKHTP
jgi:hypothetical protein